MQKWESTFQVPIETIRKKEAFEKKKILSPGFNFKLNGTKFNNNNKIAIHPFVKPYV